MKVTVFYPDSHHAAWSMSWGLAATLRRMGHEVTDGPVPTERLQVDEQELEGIKETLPSLGALKRADLILVSGPEHVAPWLDTVYGQYEWKNLGVPKAGWYHESFFRDDYTIDFDTLNVWADEHFFPAVQDADFFDQDSFAKGRAHWLPFGVDTKMFREFGTEDCVIAPNGRIKEVWPIAFVGMMYEKREKFLKALSHHHFPKIRIGTVGVEDLGGWCPRESTERLASNYRRIGVFFNLPAMSGLLVTKLYEVMACGTFLLTPQLANDRGAGRNMEPFESGKHLVYYRAANLPYVAQLLRDWSNDEKRVERDTVAAAGCAEVHKNHSLEKRLEVILAKCGAKVTVQ